MKRRFRAFTLIELLVVVSIIALLSSVVASSLNSARSKARDAQRIRNINELRSALELYRNANGRYPGTDSSPGSGNYQLYYVYFEEGCGLTITTPNDWKLAAWIPGLAPTYIPSLPKNSGSDGCYAYSSNGDDYILAAYRALENPVMPGNPLYARQSYSVSGGNYGANCSATSTAEYHIRTYSATSLDC